MAYLPRIFFTVSTAFAAVKPYVSNSLPAGADAP
jgi:hypothetical protein